MKKLIIPGMILLMLVVVLSGCDKKAKKVKLSSLNDSASYAIGANIGKNLRMDFKRNNIEVKWDLLSKGLMAQLIDTMDMFSDDEKRMIMERFQAEMQGKEEKQMKEQADKNDQIGKAFLAENKKKAGIIELPSGLQYKIIKMGNGKMPKDTDVVTVNYTGKLINGKVFDSSYERGQPATFKLNEVIRGWTEGLQLIKEGGKLELYIPANLAYGERKAGEDIEPGSTLIFEVELMKVGEDKK